MTSAHSREQSVFLPLRLFRSLPRFPFLIAHQRAHGDPPDCCERYALYDDQSAKPGKTEATDAVVTAEAVTQKTMRSVPVKSAKQQAAVMVLKTRALLVRRRTQAINALCAHMGELGIIAPTGIANFKALAPIIRDEEDTRLPPAVRVALTKIINQIEMLATQIDKLEHEIVIQTKQDDEMRRLATIPGAGAIIAMSVKAFVPYPADFKFARHFAARIGLTPNALSSDGKERLGQISKMGNPVLRSLLTTGAASVLIHV